MNERTKAAIAKSQDLSREAHVGSRPAWGMARCETIVTPVVPALADGIATVPFTVVVNRGGSELAKVGI
jgi:hypothetical protein